MATQADNYIPDSFAEAVAKDELETVQLPDEFEPTSDQSSPVHPAAHMVQEILYEPPVRFAVVGFVAGSVWTAIIFLSALLITHAL